MSGLMGLREAAASTFRAGAPVDSPYAIVTIARSGNRITQLNNDLTLRIRTVSTAVSIDDTGYARTPPAAACMQSATPVALVPGF